jgi:signal transduction histidine kinase
MDRLEALQGLRSDIVRERLQAARVLSKVAQPEDEIEISLALASEAVGWVRSSLRASLRRIQGGGPQNRADVIESDDEVYAGATLEVTGRLLHELEPLVGRLRVWLEKEWAQFPDSSARSHLDQVDEFLEVMRSLHAASEVPIPEAVDLSALASELRGELSTDDFPVVALAGPRKRVSSDRKLICLALRNGLRNALEAVRDVREPAVVMTWGSGRGDFYFAIIDNGVGLVRGSNAAFDMGVTSKPHHLGMGLALAKQAVLSLGGSAELSNTDQGGTKFEIRLPDPPIP